MGEGGVGEGLGAGGGEEVAGGEEGGVNDKRRFVVVVSKGRPRRPYHSHHRLLARHLAVFCFYVGILCVSASSFRKRDLIFYFIFFPLFSF